ncbi:MAG: hypothetical protein AAF656_02530 [Planctomycetota bacterium]
MPHTSGDDGPVLMPVIDERAYLPVSGWEPTADAGVRSQALVGGLLLTALVTAAWLAPKRRGLWIGTAAAVGTVGVVVWAAVLDPVRSTSGTVWIESADGVTRADRWTWYRATSATTLDVPADTDTFVVAYDRRHLATIEPTLHVDEIGAITHVRLTLPADVTAAVVRVGDGEPTLGSGQSPLRTMARKWYLRPGREIVGEGANGVLIRERPPR